MSRTFFSTVQEPSRLIQAHLICGPPSSHGGINEQDSTYTPLIEPYYWGLYMQPGMEHPLITLMPDVKQAFLFLRACACSVLWNERCRIKTTNIPRTTKQLHTATMADIQKHINLLYTSACYWDEWNPPQENKRFILDQSKLS